MSTSQNITIEVVDGYAESPHYEDHKRGKNWTAKVVPHRPSPGGLDRTFLKTVRNNLYFPVDDIEVGDCIEFGADYYSTRGRKQPSRMYFVVESVSEDAITGTLSSDKPTRK